MTFVLLIGALVLSGIVGSLSAMAGQLYERRRWEQRLLERVGLPDLAAPPAVPQTIALTRSDERLDRLEQAVEAVAVEMERVGEGQRFITRLLAQRRAEAQSQNTPTSLQLDSTR